MMAVAMGSLHTVFTQLHSTLEYITLRFSTYLHGDFLQQAHDGWRVTLGLVHVLSRAHVPRASL